MATKKPTPRKTLESRFAKLMKEVQAWHKRIEALENARKQARESGDAAWDRAHGVIR